MNFSEAREALHSGQKIRHESMPEGNALVVYRRGFGYDMVIIVDSNGNLSGDHVEFSDLFFSALHNDDEWQILDDCSSEAPSC